MTCKGFLFASIFLFELTAHAATLTESFTTRADFASGSAIWNQALGKIHPTLQAMNYAATFTPLPVDVGDGSDGVFDNTTYAAFGTVVGTTLTIDTDIRPVLQVTSFTLDPTWKIVTVGSNPLKIYSLSTVVIQGEIHCEGEDGGASVGVTPGSGGNGHCGGQNGGDGGPAGGGAAQPGDDASAAVTGGTAGTGTLMGGGGGGSWSSASPPTNGPHASAPDGQAGAYVSEPDFSTLAGGAGGGGGSGDATTAGGGGGAGGGVVIIHAVGNVEIGQAPTSTTGFIYAGGGKGGDAAGTGGPGGGGGGGSIQIFSGSEIFLYNTDASGASQAPGGASGTNTAADTGAAGGLGRSWISTSTFFTSGTGHYSPIEESPGVTGFNSGDIEFNPATESIVTKAFDTNTQSFSIQSLDFTPASSDFLFEVAGSSDNFASDDTGFQTDPALVANKRYLKMRLSITTSNVVTPDMIDSATITYLLSGGTQNLIAGQNSFNFKSAGCGRIDGGSAGNSLWLLLTPLMLIILRFRIRSRGQHAR